MYFSVITFVAILISGRSLTPWALTYPKSDIACSYWISLAVFSLRVLITSGVAAVAVVVFYHSYPLNFWIMVSKDE